MGRPIAEDGSHGPSGAVEAAPIIGVVGSDELVVQRIEAMLESPATGEAAPSLASMEDILTAGYAEALALEAERSRIERRLGEVARSVEEPISAGVTDELVALAHRLTHAEGELGRLRAVLSRLRERTRAHRGRS
jgi:hypothetical protein